MGGPLATSLETLTKLQVLYLNDNQFNGSVTWLSNFSSLSMISLVNNSFSGPLPNFTSHQMLSMQLDNNKFLGEIPQIYEELTTIVTLSLSGNKLKGPVKDIFSNMSALRVLMLNNNSLESTLPASLAKCTKLVYFDVSGNQISGTLPKFKGLENLEYFRVSRNQMVGTIPSGMFTNEFKSNISVLKSLDLAENSFSGPMSEFLPSNVNFTNLEFLSIYNNFFSGPVSLPKNIDNLKYLLLTQNCFTSINNPQNLCHAKNLTILHMGVLYRIFSNKKNQQSCNQSTSKFHYPFVSGQLNTLSCLFEPGRELQGLILTGLGLTGTIPSISNASKIQTLLLNFNKLTGTLHI